MLPNVKRICAEIVRCDLHRPLHAVANVFHKTVSGPPIALSDAVRENKLRVGINACPQPEIATLFFWRGQTASVSTDILPLLIHLDSDTGQIAKVLVHVIRERFASLANDANDGV